MDETARTRATARSYVERAEARDWEGFGALLAEDVVYEMPQSRERVRGKEAYLRFFSTNGLLPGTFPSLARFEREVIDYAAGLFHGSDATGSITEQQREFRLLVSENLERQPS